MISFGVEIWGFPTIFSKQPDVTWNPNGDRNCGPCFGGRYHPTFRKKAGHEMGHEWSPTFNVGHGKIQMVGWKPERRWPWFWRLGIYDHQQFQGRQFHVNGLCLTCWVLDISASYRQQLVSDHGLSKGLFLSGDVDVGFLGLLTFRDMDGSIDR